MNGYIYNVETRSIATKVKDVVGHNSTTIKGVNSKAKIGTGLYLISDQDYNEGDALPKEIEDRRGEVPILVESD